MAGWHARRRSVSADVRRPGEKRQSGKELTYDHDRDVTKSPKSEARELEKRAAATRAKRAAAASTRRTSE